MRGLFLLGLLQAQWTFTGYDASAHTAEETVDPKRRVPWGMINAEAVSAAVGYLLLFALTLAIRSVPAALGVTDAGGNKIPAVIAILPAELGPFGRRRHVVAGSHGHVILRALHRNFELAYHLRLRAR